MRRALVVAGLVLFASGCLPERDNPDDPVNRPTAIVAVTKDGTIVGVNDFQRAETAIVTSARFRRPMEVTLSWPISTWPSLIRSPATVTLPLDKRPRAFRPALCRAEESCAKSS